MATEPQPSWAVAMPVALVVMLAGHSRVRLAGQVIEGGVVSRTVIVCTQLALLAHWSVAVQVREMILAPPQRSVERRVGMMATEPQPSWAVATPVALVVVLAGHSRVKLAGQVIEGGVVSRTVIVW